MRWRQAAGSSSGAGLGRHHSPGQADNEAQCMATQKRWLMNISPSFSLTLICSLGHSSSLSHSTSSSVSITSLHTHTRMYNRRRLFPPSAKHILVSWAWLEENSCQEREREEERASERDEWRHEGTCHTVHRALGLTGTLRTWHLFQVGTKWRWHQAVSVL